MTSEKRHMFRFFRAGGFDQARLDSGADLLALDTLDQKLWVALACPTTSVNFDQRTLKLLDTDGDGRVRAPELIQACKWAGTLLRQPDDLLKGSDTLPLEAIQSGTPEGKALVDVARNVLRSLGKPDAPSISVAEASDALQVLHNAPLNGDGILETVNIPANYTITTRIVNGQEVPLMVPNGGHDQAAKRKYSAIEVFWQGNWDKLFFQGSYTYARSKGNTEGGVKSDIGQDDTGVTQDFDYPELTLGSFGYLPNDRRHSLKLFGSWEVTDEWRVGANLLVQSGRPENCIGIYGNDPVVYRVSYFSCDSGVLPADETTNTPGTRNNGYTIIPRGTAGRLPWTKTLDLNVSYQPNWMKGLTLKMDVFNVLNAREAINVSEAGEDSLGRPIDGSVSFPNAQNTFLAPTNYQTPRSVRFTARYEF